MVDQEDNEKCHSTFEKLKMKLNEKTGYYSLLIFLFNPYSIALCASKVIASYLVLVIGSINIPI